MSENLPGPAPGPRDRYRSAGLVFFALGVLKLVYGFGSGLRMIISPAGEGGTGRAVFDWISVHSRELAFAVIAFYAISAAFCFMAGIGIHRRLPIAIRLGIVYAVLQVAGIFFFKWVGIVAVANAAFGIMALTSIWLAQAFERREAAQN